MNSENNDIPENIPDSIYPIAVILSITNHATHPKHS